MHITLCTPDKRTTTPPHGDPLRKTAAQQRVVTDAPHSGTVRTVRISLAIRECTEEDVARWLQVSLGAIYGAPLDLGISFGFGVGEWGVERCVHIDSATPANFSEWLRYVLAHFGQTCAYVCFNGNEAWEFAQRGEWSRITGRK